MVSLMDSLPNEMILQVFSYFDKLEDRAVLARVSRRFNSLSKVKTWRKKINITVEDIKDHQLYKIKENKLLQEAKMSANLESLIVDDLECSGRMKKSKKKFYKVLPQILCKIFRNCLKLNEVQCKIDGKGYELFSATDEGLTIEYIDDIQLPKYFDQMVICFPGNIRSIQYSGPQTTLQTCVDRSSEVLEELECGELTPNPEFLLTLKKCKNLKNIRILLSFNVEPGVELTDIPKLNLLGFLLPENCNILNQSHNHPKLLDMFMNDSLEKLYVSDHVLSGYETLVLEKCKNLETLEIEMGREDLFSNEEAVNFYKNILTLFKQSATLTELLILRIRESFCKKFEEELLPLVQQYGFEVNSPYPLWFLKISKTI